MIESVSQLLRRIYSLIIAPHTMSFARKAKDLTKAHLKPILAFVLVRYTMLLAPTFSADNMKLLSSTMDDGPKTQGGIMETERCAGSIHR